MLTSNTATITSRAMKSRTVVVLEGDQFLKNIKKTFLKVAHQRTHDERRAPIQRDKE